MRAAMLRSLMMSCGLPVTASPPTRVHFSLESAVCKDPHRRKSWQQHRQSPHSLHQQESVQTAFSKENTNARELGVPVHSPRTEGSVMAAGGQQVNGYSWVLGAANIQNGSRFFIGKETVILLAPPRRLC